MQSRDHTTLPSRGLGLRPYNAPPNGVCALSTVMSTRLDTCMEALRSLARSSELEANRQLTAELRIRDFLTPVGTNRAAQRAALEKLDNAGSREAELRPREASFWPIQSKFSVANRRAMKSLISWMSCVARAGATPYAQNSIMRGAVALRKFCEKSKGMALSLCDMSTSCHRTKRRWTPIQY